MIWAERREKRAYPNSWTSIRSRRGLHDSVGFITSRRKCATASTAESGRPGPARRSSCAVATRPSMPTAPTPRRTAIGTAGERPAACRSTARGTPVDGATGLQSFVSLVRGTVAGRSGLGPDHLHQEPRPAAERRCVHEVHDQASEPSSGQTTIVGRAFFGGRNTDRSLGFAEEFSSQGRQRR